MRILIKGGVWKNSEDEVLKAAVMKYGLNNWSRVASLLARKSPKQCKARWYEWLDPSIKKTEWTREEEEKLLHLAKLFPTQWRTIAPIVGRTAYQCLEHYEKLLDQAQGRDEMDENDPRRLKPGEIDPHPETKPARADAIDMDEDEKEMLSEARARLANTRGKKAKRKGREKALEEARRLAALQKRRELKAAGISTMKKFRPRRGVDYAEEVPFEAAPPMGFHAVGAEETPRVALGLGNITLQAVENRTRQEEEDKLRKDDDRKLKRLKEDNLPEAIEMINKLNDPDQRRRRTQLTLPSPQLNDEELESIVKMGADAAAIAAQSADSSTASLVQSYGETPGSTPLRTPKQQNTVLMEAQDAIARTAMQTPLYGGTNPKMHETDFTGALPTPKSNFTPNVYAEKARGMTPGTTPGATPGATPGGGRTPLAGGTPATPGALSSGNATGALRDGLMLNNGEEEDEGLPPQMKKARTQMHIKNQLSSLPAPTNEVEISMPELEQEEPQGEADLEEDAADADKRRAEEERLRLEQERLKQSRAVQQGLPRPAAPQQMTAPQPEGARSGLLGSDVERAEALLFDELVALATHDAFHHPIKGAKPPKKAPEVEDFSLVELQAADALLSEEATTFVEAAGGDEVVSSALQAVLEESLGMAYLPETKRYMEWSICSNPQRLEAASHMFKAAEAQLQKEAKRAKKLDDKLERVLGGYIGKSRQSTAKIGAYAEERETTAMEIEVFRTLAAREEKAIESRVEELRDIVEAEKSRNSKLQNRFKNLKLLERQLSEKLQ